MTRLLCRVMIFLSGFELAVTPKYAGHYGQLRLDVAYWECEYHKQLVRRMYAR